MRGIVLHISEAYEHEPILPYQPEDTCPINSCNKTVSQCVEVSAPVTLTEELRRAASFGAMTGEELLTCQRTAVRAAFCAEETKAALLAALADFEARL